ncbi:DUF2268 domain-containing putative Zn-dependent protease [Seonamhaeicola sp.]|uniref:DUF2268 domain-containing putative Zn-dependent protease n=1 Tax=Seonamhaeicola sp. TaxID=1912245 RepID=UPI002635687D|nr:DUF2268 domain-containing putative Zn-dependent protease [Seonamhaeicola sp.]
MKFCHYIFLSAILTFTFESCKTESKEHDYSPEKLAIFKQLESYPDSIQIGGINFQYGFKNQMLAHLKGNYDSTLITEKFHKPNQYLFDSCFNFFPDKIYTLPEVIKWNKTYLIDNDSIVWKQIKFLLEKNIDSLIRSHAKGVQDLTGIVSDAKFLLYLPPYGFGISGGCNTMSMSFDMMYKIEDEKYIQQVIPHEVEHTVYENMMGDDPYFSTGIGVIIDEGLASFFEHKYLNISAFDVLNEHEWFMENEKEIFEKLSPYFLKPNTEDNRILYHVNRNNNLEPLIDNAPSKLAVQNLGYNLGFRIVESYEKINGTDSWKDVYMLSPKEFLEKSGYEDYIKSL